MRQNVVPLVTHIIALMIYMALLIYSCSNSEKPHSQSPLVVSIPDSVFHANDFDSIESKSRVWPKYYDTMYMHPGDTVMLSSAQGNVMLIWSKK